MVGCGEGEKEARFLPLSRLRGRESREGRRSRGWRRGRADERVGVAVRGTASRPQLSDGSGGALAERTRVGDDGLGFSQDAAIELALWPTVF